MERLAVEPTDGDELDLERAGIYKSCVGKLLFAAKDRPDLAFAVKELSRDLKNPLERSWRKMKRCGRYVAGLLDLGLRFQKSGREELVVDAFVDSDWAGIAEEGDDLRKSTSGGLVFLCGMLVGFYSRTQKQRALSSCEAEFLSIATGTQEAMFVSKIASFIFGAPVKVRVWSDSSS